MSTEGNLPASEARLLRFMARLRWLLVVLAATLCGFSWWSFARADPQAATAPRFYCPMHPEVKSSDPGECPICHMTLEPIPEARKKSAPQKPATAGPPSSASAGPAAALPPGVSSDIQLRLDRVQAINVRTRKARALPGQGKLVVPAVVEAQERGRAEVHVRSSGFVERISVREVGARVKAGQELFSLFSPEIYQAQAELVALAKVGGSTDPGIERAKKRLELLGVPGAVSDRLAASGTASRTISVNAPISGYVARVSVVLGSFVNPDAALYEIIDPSRIYVVASVPESRAPEVKLGQEAVFGSSDQQLSGVSAKVDLIYPELDRSARAVRIRFSLDNPQGRILPGQFGSVQLSLSAEPSVAVPRDAVVDTGRGAYVFVDEGEGRFRAAPVELGAVLPDDEIEIRRGIADQDSVVSGAAFLIDSESRLRAAVAPVD